MILSLYIGAKPEQIEGDAGREVHCTKVRVRTVSNKTKGPRRLRALAFVASPRPTNSTTGAITWVSARLKVAQCSKKLAGRFYKTIEDMRNYFKQKGAWSKAAPSKLGFQVKHSSGWLHLLYFYVTKVTKPTIAEIGLPFLIAQVFVQAGELEKLRHLMGTEMRTANGVIVGRTANEPASWNKNLILAYEYVGNLNNCFAGSAVETAHWQTCLRARRCCCSRASHTVN